MSIGLLFDKSDFSSTLLSFMVFDLNWFLDLSSVVVRPPVLATLEEFYVLGRELTLIWLLVS